MLITVKVVALFNNGIELHKLSDTLTFAEGQVESLCQTGLQLYIIFKRDDRNEKKTCGISSSFCFDVDNLLKFSGEISNFSG